MSSQLLQAFLLLSAHVAITTMVDMLTASCWFIN